MNLEHLKPSRVWGLIRDQDKLLPEEIEHVRTCPRCHGWLIEFAAQARRAGFTVQLNIPALTPPEDQSKGA